MTPSIKHEITCKLNKSSPVISQSGEGWRCQRWCFCQVLPEPSPCPRSGWNRRVQDKESEGTAEAYIPWIGNQVRSWAAVNWTDPSGAADGQVFLRGTLGRREPTPSLRLNSILACYPPSSPFLPIRLIISGIAVITKETTKYPTFCLCTQQLNSTQVFLESIWVCRHTFNNQQWLERTSKDQMLAAF